MLDGHDASEGDGRGADAGRPVHSGRVRRHPQNAVLAPLPCPQLMAEGIGFYLPPSTSKRGAGGLDISRPEARDRGGSALTYPPAVLRPSDENIPLRSRPHRPPPVHPGEDLIPE